MAKTPNAARHKPTPAYARKLFKATGLAYPAISTAIGVSVRTIERYAEKGGFSYPTQYALEALGEARAGRARKAPAGQAADPLAGIAIG